VAVPPDQTRDFSHQHAYRLNPLESRKFLSYGETFSVAQTPFLQMAKCIYRYLLRFWFL